MTRYQSASLTLRHCHETAQFGFLLGQLANPGDVICLDGDLGAGKTTLTQAIARGLGVSSKQAVTSPSFAIFQEYQGRIPLYHFDLYRLHGADDVLALGLEEYFYLSGCAVIEWSERAANILPENRLRLELKIVDMEARNVFCQYHAKGWAPRWRILAENISITR